MWKKFKNWLIKKLGGWVAPPPNELIVNHYIENPVEIKTTIRIDNKTLHNCPEMVDHIKEDAVQKLAKMLRECGLIEQKRDIDFNSDSQLITLSIKVMKPYGPLEPSIESNVRQWDKMITDNNCYYENGFKKETLYGERPY